MTRLLKQLGQGLAVLAFVGALLAPTVSAAEFHAEAAPALLTGKQEAANEHALSVNFGKLACESVTFKGTQGAVTANSLSLDPVYSGPGGHCSFAGVTAKVDMNGCVYTVEAIGKVSIVCPMGKEMTITAPPTSPKCTIHIPTQAGIGNVAFSNVGMGATREVTMTFALFGIKYSQTEGSGLGRCPTSDAQVNGTYAGKALFTAENEAATAHLGFFYT